MDDARAFGQWRVAHRLVERGARTTMHDAATLGLTDRLEGYFASATPPDAEEVNRAFWGVCHGGQLLCARYLLDRGAQLNWIPDWENRTPLGAAVRSGATELARVAARQRRHHRSRVGPIAANAGRRVVLGRIGRTMADVVAFTLPVNLVQSVRLDPSAERREWLHILPEIVGELAQRWSLRLAQPYQPGGQCAWVAPARTATGRDLVLKVAWRHDEAADEANGLRAWNGQGTVQLHDSHSLGATSVLLLERCHPGTTLAEALPEPEQDAVVAGLLRRLWTVPTGGYPFRALQVMCDAWAAEFDEKLATCPGAFDPGLARAGIELFRALPATAERQVLLCTDLHAGNILAAQREPWLVIDPKPYLGDPTYDALQHMLNCEQRLAADPTGLARRMADLLDLDADRLALWLFARCVQEAIDQPELRDVAAHLGRLITG